MSAPQPALTVVNTATLGFVVSFAAAPHKLSPQVLRDTVEKRMLADLGQRAYVTHTDSKGIVTRSMLFRDSLPEVISPVAALGLATRDAVVAATARTPATRWVHCSRKDGCSRWIYADADVTDDRVRISGNAGAEVNAAGDLVIDADIPASIATTLRASYDAARGVVEPSKINAAIVRYLKAARGSQLSPSTFLLSAAPDDVRAVLAAVVDLKGYAGCYQIGAHDAVNVAALVAPVQQSLEAEIAAVLADTDATIERAKLAQQNDGPNMQERSGDSAHAAIDDVTAKLSLWSDRLGLAMAEVAARLTEAKSALDVEVDLALAAVARRKAARAAAKAA